MAHGKSLGRSALMRANHARLDELPGHLQEAPLRPKGGLRAGWPAWLPGGFVRGSTVRAFNEAYYRKAPATRTDAIESLIPYFYPLDALANWNRAYGARGFVQYQFVVPYGSESALRAVIERLSGAGCPTMVTVLKRMGPGHGMLSFPIEGWTLTFDIPSATRGLADLLDELDRIVVDAGGRIYLAKDARLRPELLPDMYPELDRFREFRRRLDPDGCMSSDLGRRLNLL
jgi:decaprenylphospho-beta-D-ribofuranose 2-oxidase